MRNARLYSKQRTVFFATCFLALCFLIPPSALFAVEVKLKDIAKINPIRENQLTGYGLVVGLNGSGDTKSPLTEEALANYLAQLGVNTKKPIREPRNTASVILTASVSVSLKEGERIDVIVSSLGDARSLEGGVLLQSPLKAGNGETIAVASGVLQFGGKDKKGKGIAEKKGSTNTGIVLNGAILEKSVPSNLVLNQVRITLIEKDYATLNAVVEAIKGGLSVEPEVLSATELSVPVPAGTNGNGKIDTVFLSKLENLTLTPETVARVVINERTGTIVMGAGIAIDEVAISQQGLTIQVASPKKQRFLFPLPEDDKGDSVFVLKEATQVSDVVDALNKVGASTKDIISILEALKKQGALKAELIVQ